jgi:hypothetical protein
MDCLGLIRCGRSHLRLTDSPCRRRKVSGMKRSQRRSRAGRSTGGRSARIDNRSSPLVFGWGTWRRRTAGSWRRPAARDPSNEKIDMRARASAAPGEGQSGQDRRSCTESWGNDSVGPWGHRMAGQIGDRLPAPFRADLDPHLPVDVDRGEVVDEAPGADRPPDPFA